MTNMAYCRFRNTLQDHRDCYAHIHDPLIASSIEGEHSARQQLLELCALILEECDGVTVEVAPVGGIQITEHANRGECDA
jgi:hypothetical protein